MRETKFRAWDKINKEMVFNQFCVTAYGLIQKSEISREYHSWKNEDWELLQFTGLKDKNGKEIYEGDIVEYFVTKDIPKQRTEIEWDKNKAGFSVPNKDFFKLKIIGNIYENSELIKEDRR